MPLKGDKNTLFGIYRNTCCGAEIVISVGAVFPPCPRHQDTGAEWIQIEGPSQNASFSADQPRDERRAA